MPLFDASDYKCKYTLIIQNLVSTEKSKEPVEKWMPVVSLLGDTTVYIMQHIFLFFLVSLLLP